MELVKLIEELINQSVNVSKFTDIEFGEVVEESPLKIKINEIIILEEDNLILTNAVKDHKIDITVQWISEDNNIPSVDSHIHDSKWGAGVFTSPGLDSTHNHPIKGKKKIIVHNNLKKEEKVLLIKSIGGQKYVVVDRLTDFETEGQWEE